jgi:hypothetical protein
MKSFDQVDLRNNHIDDIPREVRWSTDFEGQLMTDIPDEILENLYLGPISASQNRIVLEKVPRSINIFLADQSLLEENNAHTESRRGSSSRVS